MITICSRWETSQMPVKVEWQMWRQLRGAFRIQRMVFVPVLEEMKDFHVEQYETMEEALVASREGSRIFLEPKGKKTLGDMRGLTGQPVVFILGNTAQDNVHLAHDCETYRISTPQRTHLYGISAAAIALAYWVGQ